MSFILVLSYTKYIPHISYSCVTSVRLMVHYGQDYYYYFPPLRFTFWTTPAWWQSSQVYHPPAPPATNKTITQQVTARQRIISNTARLYLQQSQYTSGWLTGLRGFSYMERFLVSGLAGWRGHNLLTWFIFNRLLNCIMSDLSNLYGQYQLSKLNKSGRSKLKRKLSVNCDILGHQY